jgi:saccharopine dehydrogenase (NAD+, L-lysine-forming)
MAGFAGAAVSIDVWCHQLINKGQVYGEIKPYPNEEALVDFTKNRLAAAIKKHNNQYPNVMVMGALGRCGSGAVDFCRKAGIPEENIIKWDMNETKRGGPFKEITDSGKFIYYTCIYCVFINMDKK